MKLIAKKPCSFGGRRFYIGEEIPAELVAKPKEQEKMGVLVQVSDAQGHPAPDADTPSAEPSTITVCIHGEEGDLPLELTADALQSVVDVLTGTVEEAEPVIGQMEGDSLILLHLADSRKSIKAAAEARAKSLNEQESEGEQEGQESEGEQ